MKTLTFTSSLHLLSGDTVVMSGLSYDVVSQESSTQFIIRAWPWWKYWWTPIRQFFVRLWCSIFGPIWNRGKT